MNAAASGMSMCIGSLFLLVVILIRFMASSGPAGVRVEVMHPRTFFDTGSGPASTTRILEFLVYLVGAAGFEPATPAV